MRAAGNPGTVRLPCAKPRAFRRTPQITGWIVLPVDREDFEEPHRYEPGLLLSVDGTFHRLDSELRGWGQRDFPRYEQRVSPEPVELRADQEQPSSTRWPRCTPRTDHGSRHFAANLTATAEMLTKSSSAAIPRKGTPMRSLRPIRSLPLLIAAAAATATVGTAHAYTPPIGTDKGSLTAAPAPHANFIMFDHNYS